MEDLEVFYSVYALYLWAGLTAVVLLLALWVAALQIRLSRIARSYRQMMAGVDQGNLEDALERQTGYLQQTNEKLQALSLDLQEVGKSLEGTIQRVGLVRFNPFADTGGDQSFSVALLDGRGDGFVLTSLFSRSDTRVFAKPVQRGQSKYTLSNEEAQAIDLAGGAASPAGSSEPPHSPAPPPRRLA